MPGKVLIITYHFPPRPSVAGLRMRGLAKYLPEYGWEPAILTPELPEAPERQFRVVQTAYPGDVYARWKTKFGLKAEKDFLDQVKVPRAWRESNSSIVSRLAILARSLIAYPDEQRGWRQFAVGEGSALLEKERFDVMLSSSFPATCHLIAHELKNQHGIPWIANFQDPWTQNHYYSYTRAGRFFERRLEVKTLSNADALVIVSEPWAEKLRLLHHEKKVYVIKNGYDPDEVVSAPLTSKFTITYTGRIYQEKQDPNPLLRAISEVVSCGEMNREHVDIRFVGSPEHLIEKEIKRLGLEDIVSLSPQVPRHIALEKQRESQVLLLLNWDDPGEVGVHTAKIFEYLAARRPILAIGGPRSVVSELLEETGAGIHAQGHEHLKRVLMSFYEDYMNRGHVVYSGREECIAKYSHREMAKRFASLMDELSKGEPRSRS